MQLWRRVLQRSLQQMRRQLASCAAAHMGSMHTAGAVPVVQLVQHMDTFSVCHACKPHTVPPVNHPAACALNALHCTVNGAIQARQDASKPAR
jgi:hypothetical protein